MWHKHKLSILSNFGPYILMFSGRGSTRSPRSGCGRPKVGVVAKFLRALRAHYIYFLLCPGLSFHKLGNYATMAARRTVVQTSLSSPVTREHQQVAISFASLVRLLTQQAPNGLHLLIIASRSCMHDVACCEWLVVVYSIAGTIGYWRFN